jgi:dolichol-phosphate mannosyltransferase
MKITIVSPTYNEAENLARLAAEVHTALSDTDYELLIADDNSPDLTWAIAERICATNAHVRVLRRMTNRGLSAAVMEGISSCSSEYVGVIDADLQHDPAILPAMISALDAGADVAIATRYAKGGGTGSWSSARRFQSLVATNLAKAFLGIELSDPMSGYFLLRRSDFNRVANQLDSRGFKILLELMARLGRSKIKEVPYTFRTRAAGKSKLTSKIIFQYLGQLWRLSSVSRYMSVRFIKFAIVGASGTIVNLFAFLLCARLLGLRDWRVSALATAFANLTNYIFNNAWTFGDRVHRGLSLFRGYASYLGFSSVGMLASTLTFAGLSLADKANVVHFRSSEAQYALAGGCQLVAILVGTIFNYELNKRFTWRNRRSAESLSQTVRQALGSHSKTDGEPIHT